MNARVSRILRKMAYELAVEYKATDDAKHRKENGAIYRSGPPRIYKQLKKQYTRTPNPLKPSFLRGGFKAA